MAIVSERSLYHDPQSRHDRVHVLIGRLETGWTLIDEEPDPQRKARLEDRWIALLHDYEAASEHATISSDPGGVG